MSASYKTTNETYFPSVETLDIERTLKSTAALDIDILLLGRRVLARIPWPNESIVCRGDEVILSQ